jgi:transposase
MHKKGLGHRHRGSLPKPEGVGLVRYAGIDIGSEKHVLAIVDREENVLLKPRTFLEDDIGYSKMLEALGSTDVLVCMEATGHYWQNLFATLVGNGYQVALVNPLRTHRFMGEDLARTKTDAIDALGLARFAAQKRPKPAQLPDEANEELRELVRLRDRIVQEMGDKTRQLHRLVDLGFPEFKRLVDDLQGPLATTILAKYPTAAAFKGVHPGTLAKLVFDRRNHSVGLERAKEIVAAAKISVGRHHGEAYKLQIRYLCADLELLRTRLKELEHDTDNTVQKHDLAKLYVQLDGIGPTTAARIVAELGDVSRFNAKQLASFVALVPALKHSGKSAPERAGLSNLGNVPFRSALWMPMLVAVRRNAWLKHFYDRLIARGKLPKVALIASMRKLLVALIWIAKNKKPFVPRVPVTA